MTFRANLSVITKLLESLDTTKLDDILPSVISEENPIEGYASTVNRLLELDSSVTSYSYTLAIRIAKVYQREFRHGQHIPRIKLSRKASLNVIEGVAIKCLITDKSNLENDFQHVSDLFTLFIITDDIWNMKAVCILAILALTLHLSEVQADFINAMFKDLMRKYKRFKNTLLVECHDVVVQANLSNGKDARVLELGSVAKAILDEYGYKKDTNVAASHLPYEELVDRHIHANQMAEQLIMEEEKEKAKEDRKKNKKKRKQTKTPPKTPYIDEDPVFEEKECVICMETSPDMLFECGHKICCTGCSVKIKNKCPFCSTE